MHRRQVDVDDRPARVVAKVRRAVPAEETCRDGDKGALRVPSVLPLKPEGRPGGAQCGEREVERVALPEGAWLALDVEARPRVLLRQLPLLVGLGGGLVDVDFEREQLHARDDGAVDEEAPLVGFKRLQDGREVAQPVGYRRERAEDRVGLGWAAVGRDGWLRTTQLGSWLRTTPLGPRLLHRRQLRRQLRCHRLRREIGRAHV